MLPRDSAQIRDRFSTDGLGISLMRCAQAQPGLISWMRLAEAPAESAIPWLENGDRLHAAEFLRRYDAMPPGIQEYLVWLTADRTVHWFHLVDGIDTANKPTSATLHSQVHPGLVLDVAALLAHDRPRLVAALESR